MSGESIRLLLTVALILLSLCAVLLTVLLLTHASDRRKTSRTLRTLSDRLIRDLEDMEDAQEAQNSRQREELSQNLHAVHDSLVNTLSGMTQTYGDHVNAVLRQNSENARMADLRQQNLERAVADRLSGVTAGAEALRQSVDARLARLEEGNARKLDEMRAVVDEKLNETLDKRLNESFSRVSERLEQVYQSLGEIRSLTGGVDDLKRMLGNVKTRGIWGEAQLGALLEQTLTDTQYRTNVEVVPGSGERVEFAVVLPGRDNGDGPVLLPIDSKFPQEDYLRLTQAAGDPAAAEEASRALMNTVKTEAKRIGKYIAPPHSTDFAVMFLPLESLYAEVMRHSEAAEAIRREQRVLISGPSTLLAMLSSLQMGFRTLAIEKRSAEVWKLLGAVKGDFRNYAALLQKTQEKLQQASDSVDTAFRKTRGIERRLRDVETLEGEEAAALLGDKYEGAE